MGGTGRLSPRPKTSPDDWGLEARDQSARHTCALRGVNHFANALERGKGRAVHGVDDSTDVLFLQAGKGKCKGIDYLNGEGGRMKGML